MTRFGLTLALLASYSSLLAQDGGEEYAVDFASPESVCGAFLHCLAHDDPYLLPYLVDPRLENDADAERLANAVSENGEAFQYLARRFEGFAIHGKARYRQGGTLAEVQLRGPEGKRQRLTLVRRYGCWFLLRLEYD